MEGSVSSAVDAGERWDGRISTILRVSEWLENASIQANNPHHRK